MSKADTEIKVAKEVIGVRVHPSVKKRIQDIADNEDRSPAYITERLINYAIKRLYAPTNGRKGRRAESGKAQAAA